MKTRTTRHLFAAATLAAALAACTSATPRSDSAATGDQAAAPADSNAAHPSAIIPRPLQIVAGRGSFVFDANTPIRIKPGQPGERRVADYFAQRVQALRGFAPAVTEAPGGRGAVWLNIDPNLTIGDEAYELDVQADTVRLSARTEAGLFYGAVSLWQLATADG
ncbi:glycoside hydrolase family 20 zincin-like fold domain-containing protein, partial [Lysobacter sp. 2RAB21]